MSNEYVREADRALEAAYDEPMTLAEFVESLDDHPERAAHASKYLLRAVEHFGTRTVVEEGEERERWRFFDDPANDGEHAVLGNTAVLNGFVEDLRAIAAGRGKGEKILWFAGPTATGKSELKRCLVNGLRAYSKTPEGRRYTVEWNVAGVDADPGLTYGDGALDVDEDDWYESPVQANPLAVFPDAVRDRIAEDVEDGGTVPTRADAELDPFSREAYEFLEEQYRRDGREDLFSAVTDSQHLRVKNYVMDVGAGIGVLHAEDTGSPKERLVGSWMPELLAQLDSRGRKNPQAFSYDGVLSQGNGGLTIVEDAAQHADLLRKLLNVPDERAVKLDKGITMDVDTQLVVISNLDLEAQLNQHADKQSYDPLKALKRRLDKREFTYLTNLSLEAQLFRRELTGETAVWTDEESDERVREGVSVTVGDGTGGRREREIAPHAVTAAALYDVVTRLDDDDLPSGMDLVDKAILYDQGYLRDGDERVTTDDVDLDGEDEGRNGIPITYTRDVVADLLSAETDRHHEVLRVEDVVMPRDVLNAMVESLDDAPVFSGSERELYANRVVAVKDEVFGRQEADVIEAIMADRQVDEETVAEYVEGVYAQATGGTVETPEGSAEPDPLKLKVFEVEHLGRFDEDDYDGTEPSAKVREFREGKIITALNRHAWESRTDDFRIGDVDLTEIPVIKTVLDATDWDDVGRAYPDLDPEQWDDPPADTETAAVKEAAVERMVEDHGYSPASAELTSRHVMNQVSYRWD